jgi:hypothetical protein
MDKSNPELSGRQPGLLKKRAPKPKALPAAHPTKPSPSGPERELPPPRFKPGGNGRAVELDLGLNMENALTLARTFGTKDLDVIWHFMQQLAGAVPNASSLDAKLNRTVPILHSLRPRDELEAMLFVQMVGVHNAAMDCLERGLHPHQVPEGVEANINRATALTKVFLGQLEALQKYRGKGSQQRVTVEHVHVHKGGQAIVGAVQPRGRGRGDERQL